MKVSHYIFILLIFLSTFLLGQENPEKLREVQNKINELREKKDVSGINRLINTNNSLDPQYIYKTLNENLKLAQALNNEQQIADTYLTIGLFWFHRGNKAKAYENYYESERRYKKINDFPRTGILVMNRAILTEDIETRIELYKEAISILKKTDDLVNLSKAYLNIGNAYSVHIFEKDTIQNPYENNEIAYYKKNAFKNYASADSLNQEIKDRLISAGIYVYKAEWYKFEKEYSLARKFFHLAAEDFKKANFIKGEVNCIIELAHIEKKQLQFSKSLKLLKEAENISKQYKFDDYLAAIYQEYSNIFMEQGDYKTALEFHKKFYKENTALLEQNSQDKIYMLNLEHNMTENEYKIEKYESQSKINNILLIIIVLIALFIGGVSYLIIKNNKRKINNIEQNKVITELEKSAVEIKLKNQLLEEELLKEKVKYSQNNLITFANQVNKIDTFLDDLKTEMKGNLTSVEKQEKINDLKISFAEVLNNQNELTQINSLSSELNQEFFFYIRKNYPSITKEDEQLLSFLILNLSSQEISKKLNIAIRSVYTKRYRLRKKLNLQENEKLIDYYRKTLILLD